MNIIALQTARKGSKSVRNKNTLMIDDKPLFLHNIIYALKSSYISNVYISTDDETIMSYKEKYDIKIIERPYELTTDMSAQYDVIVHALHEIEKQEDKKIDIIVILLGNALGATTEDVDKSIEILINDPEADSCMSVSTFNMFNPFRAYKSAGTYLDTILEQSFMANNSQHKDIDDKASAGDVYFFNGSFWICKRDTVINNNGLLPFPWLGNKILYCPQDITMEVDAQWQADFLKYSAENI